MNKLSLRWKVAALNLTVFFAVVAALLCFDYRQVRQIKEQELMLRAERVMDAAESVHALFARQWDRKSTPPVRSDQGTDDAETGTIPINAVWKTAVDLAERDGLTFRVIAQRPRNPDHRPDATEARVLKLFADGKAERHVEIDDADANLRVFRPIKVTGVCLKCHGDPSSSKTLWNNDRGTDPTGAPMENLAVGQTHGAYEVLVPLAPLHAALHGSMMRSIIIFAGFALFGTAVLFHVLDRFLFRRLLGIRESIQRLAEGDVTNDCEVVGQDEVGSVGSALNRTMGSMRDVIDHANRIARGDYSSQVALRTERDAFGTALADMTARLKTVADVCRAVAHGDYSQRLDVKGKEDFLAVSINTMIDNLRDVSERINEAGGRMVEASRQQADSAQNQTTATAEIASSVSELTASAKQLSDQGSLVAQQADNASEECEAGSTSVRNVVDGIQGIHQRVEVLAGHMLELGNKSQQISGILDIITELSEQTNLLSLNASIEAAGAGESGKRFAVVASEIRKLAERATDSATEIRGLIDDVQETVNAAVMATEEGAKSVQSGMQLAEEVNTSFERIMGQVVKTAESAKVIEMVSRQQAVALEQLEQAMRDIDEAAQQTAGNAARMNDEVCELLKSAKRLRGEAIATLGA